MKILGDRPVDLGKVDLQFDEVLYYLYLPIKLAVSPIVRVPKQLKNRNLADALLKIVHDIGTEAYYNSNVYLTIKRMYVGGSVTANRPGWHTDGFGTDDLNYIWYDALPTRFNDSHFEVSDDHVVSQKQMEEQADPKNDFFMPCRHLLRLDERVVHAVDHCEKQIMRTFVKISVSKNKYNLKGNSKNYDLDYDWEMVDREEIRNDPHRAQNDFYKGVS